MKLRITSIQNLIVFLKRLKQVDRNVVLEITSEKIFCKVHTPDKSVMKYSALDFGDVFESDFDWTSIKNDRVKIGLTDVGRLMDSFKHFRPEEEVHLELNVEKVDGDSVATELRLISPSLNIKLRCANLDLLSYVEDKILEIVHSRVEERANFKLYQSDFTTVLSLCGLDTNSEEILTFEVNDKTAHGIGDSFNYKLNIGTTEIMLDEGEKSVSAGIYKNRLSNMEPELCEVYVHSNRVVMFSEQSDTAIAIGLVEK
jgi:hypothetical protein